jgi:hypothetical protein
VQGEAAFYAIANWAIGKYDKKTGSQLATWTATDELPLRHLNSGDRSETWWRRRVGGKIPSTRAAHFEP